MSVNSLAAKAPKAEMHAQEKALQNLGFMASEKTRTKKNDLGQQDFMRLLTAQLNNQDPTKPQEGADFVAQLAQFNQVQSTEKVLACLEGLAASFHTSQTSLASSLIDKSVQAPGQDFRVKARSEGEAALTGTVELPQALDRPVLKVFDMSDQLVAELDFDVKTQGIHEFVWDGKRTNGEQAVPGKYKIAASAKVDGEELSLKTNLNRTVTSVVMHAKEGLSLALDNGTQIKLTDVQKIS